MASLRFWMSCSVANVRQWPRLPGIHFQNSLKGQHIINMYTLYSLGVPCGMCYLQLFRSTIYRFTIISLIYIKCTFVMHLAPLIKWKWMYLIFITYKLQDRLKFRYWSAWREQSSGTRQLRKKNKGTQSHKKKCREAVGLWSSRQEFEQKYRPTILQTPYHVFLSI